MKSIFYLAENFRRCVVCPLAHQSQGQFFEHPSRASAFSREPSRTPRQAPAKSVGGGRHKGGGWGEGNELTGEMGRLC